MENMQYILLDSNSKIIFSTIKEEQKDIIDNIKEGYSRISFQGINYRVAKIINENGTLYVYTSNKKFILSSSFFKRHVQIIIDTINHFEFFQSQIEKEVFRHINILIHNLTTINAHNIQEIFNFLPQNELAEKNKFITKFIKERLIEDPNKAAIVFLKLMKNNIATKIEFSVFSKLFEDKPILNQKSYELSSMILNVMYNFFSDFLDKNITINFEEKQCDAYFDYESIQVALFHLLDNTAKYIKEESTLNIKFEILINQVDIIFEMISLKVDNDEVSKIFIEGFSGKYAKDNGKSGKGIGMARVKQILELNNGSISLEKNYSSSASNIYDKNIFKISLKKENYFI